MADDPLLSYLRSVHNLLVSDEFDSPNFRNLLIECISAFKLDPRYQNDLRFLRIWFLYMDGCEDYEMVFKEMEGNKICLRECLLYETYARFLEGKGRLMDAHNVYLLGISRCSRARNAEPIQTLKKAHTGFLDRMSAIIKACSLQKSEIGKSAKAVKAYTNPWLIATIKDVLKKNQSKILKYAGYHLNNKNYPGKLALSSLQSSSRNKIIEIGRIKYQIKGCSGKGGFAQVFKAYVDSNPDEVVALKIQKPPFPWEFYMYRQLDERIPNVERLCYGSAHRVHLYADYSILVCDFLAHGTLQDAINSYAVTGQAMEDVLCMYYTIEMLRMLETLHSVGIIHGDFKPDNLLIRYARDDLTEDGFRYRNGPWREQGLCLVDWGKGIDLSLFPQDAEFMGDSRTSGFRCVEMQEKRPWKFQVDTYGLCVNVHMMLHNKYMEIEKKVSADGSCTYGPKSPFKRYWNVELWKMLFARLLNSRPVENSTATLKQIREAFQDYLCSKPEHIKKLKHLLFKQRATLCSAA